MSKRQHNIVLERNKIKPLAHLLRTQKKPFTSDKKKCNDLIKLFKNVYRKKRKIYVQIRSLTPISHSAARVHSHTHTLIPLNA